MSSSRRTRLASQAERRRPAGAAAGAITRDRDVPAAAGRRARRAALRHAAHGRGVRLRLLAVRRHPGRRPRAAGLAARAGHGGVSPASCGWSCATTRTPCGCPRRPVTAACWSRSADLERPAASAAGRAHPEVVRAEAEPVQARRRAPRPGDPSGHGRSPAPTRVRDAAEPPCVARSARVTGRDLAPAERPRQGPQGARSWRGTSRDPFGAHRRRRRRHRRPCCSPGRRSCARPRSRSTPASAGAAPPGGPT